jgi:DNA-binding transcriptional LysR family regulator
MQFDTRLLDGIGVVMAIVDNGSFVRAAETLDMTQSGVSRAVARMEARLGVRLFDRTTRSVTLTDEGRRFCEEVTPLLAQLEEVTSAASRGSVRCAAGCASISIRTFPGWCWVRAWASL